MSAFTKKSRPIAHPDWLRGALNDFSRTQRLYLSGILPKAIEFPMVTVPFLDHAGIDYSERKPIPIDINPDVEMFVEVKVPESQMKKKPPQTRLFVEKSG